MGLHTFHVPHPNPALIRALGWVNDHAILPRVARVQAVHVPAEDEARLRAAARHPFVLCPNHPEFFTDWMVDKWIMDRFAPRAIAWADPEVVNGMGAFGRWFWLSNGLVAAVKGPDLDKALAWSSEQVAAGAGALIHPEGEVNWDNEAPAALRPGAVRIALGAAPRVSGAVQLVPLAWFLRYATDATAGLHRELDYVAARLRIARPEGADPAARLGALFQALLEREAAPWELPLGERTQGFAARLAIGLRAALERLADAWPDLVPAALAGDDRARARAWRQHARRLRDAPTEFKRQVGIMDRMVRLVPAAADQPRLTQEQVGERLKRLRLDWLRGTLRDDVTRFVPRAVASRELFVRVGAPVPVVAGADPGAALAALDAGIHAALERARADGIARRGAPITYANPFHG